MRSRRNNIHKETCKNMFMAMFLSFLSGDNVNDQQQNVQQEKRNCGISLQWNRLTKNASYRNYSTIKFIWSWNMQKYILLYNKYICSKILKTRVVMINAQYEIVVPLVMELGSSTCACCEVSTWCIVLLIVPLCFHCMFTSTYKKNTMNKWITA